MHRRAFLTALALSAIAATSHAQTAQRRVGIGVTFSPYAVLNIDPDEVGYLPFGFGDFYFPIRVARGVRIEPSVGVFRTSSSSHSPSYTSEGSAMFLRLGFGIFPLIPAGAGTQLYAGPRVGIVRISSSSSYTGSPEHTSHRTDKWIGLVAGGEHFFSPHFSLGAEAEVTYFKYGTEVTEPSQQPPSGYSSSMSSIQNSGLIFVRFYP